MKKITLLLLAMITTSLVGAQEQGRSLGYWDKEHRQSVNISLGSLPDIWAWDYDDFLDDNYKGLNYDDDSVIYKKSRVQSPSINVGYTYRFNRCGEVEAVVGYAYSKTHIHDLYTRKRVITESENAAMAMVVLRGMWLNTRHWSIYSSFGAGFYSSSIKNEDCIKGNDSHEFVSTGQINPLGVRYTHGRIYGLFELGYGALGVSRFGIGYKF